MLSKIYSSSLHGMEASMITVETDISRGLPGSNIIGLGDTAVKESLARVKSAITSSGFNYPNGKITTSLSPAWQRKKGSHFDLAIALSILVSSGQVFDGKMGSMGFIGELALNGSVNRCRGIMPMTEALRKAGKSKVIVPKSCLEEASLVEGVEILGAENLEDVCSYINMNENSLYSNKKRLCDDRIKGEIIGDINDKTIETACKDQLPLDYSDIKGQESAKRAAIIAAAGGHNILMIGSPGTGKTMMAERLPYILPPLDSKEIIELTSIYSVAGLLDKNNLIVRERPFRSPGVSLTVPGLLGSGAPPRPGEATLSHKGILFLDELGERPRDIIDSLRIPMEAKSIVLSRMGDTYRYPSDFMFVAATNPCKCGNYGDPRKECTCTPIELMAYKSRISGPIMGRIDIHIELSSPEYADLQNDSVLSSREMKDMVLIARKMQRRRGEVLNSGIDTSMMESFCKLTEDAGKILEDAYDKMALDPRSANKVRKVARTIADIDESEIIHAPHILEALQYREKREVR